MSSNVLKDLKPYEVFKFFEEITQIPRGSGNEKEISDYLVAFAKERNLEVIQDEALNVIIKKSGTAGYEKAPTVILQGHMDMVNEKNQNTKHDFTKDPLKLRVEGDMIYATGTTLGSDNGIAIAYALALLDSKDIPHPPIEVLLTTDEETGMSGARALNPEHLKGRILINMDSEEEGQLLVSCSGGVRTRAALKINWEKADENLISAELRVRGLKGGHSGMEINKGRGNSNKILGRILYDIYTFVDFQLVSLKGGAKDNAIPREADALIVLKKEDAEKVQEKVHIWNSILKNEFRISDADVNIQFEIVSKKYEKVFSKETTKKVIGLLNLIPNGVHSMSMEISGLVQSSTNLGVIKTDEELVHFDSATRSSVKSLKENIVNTAKIAAEAFGAEFWTESDYPEWEYDANSNIRNLFVKVYNNLYGKDPEIVAIHAGVECGLFKEKFNDIDMISFGPNLYDVHTPDEHMSISSVQNTWNYLLSVLKEIK
ncbi:aminoacyl-histidine dipeptidase [Clostridium sp. SYSU_GA19001]|uniref:aminoacyl-histidine dipeptidase n=1 Tax=Clostridium caldaquaticum TaxID=2940653 RepID=UPI00207779D5|nr:aminoacyl-histidine dipeptidase [Clostridium caldaquaticum]MCM8711684.1 aminoacyl-histidine dipeptidase [Clostridium caldaquaticum]